MKPHESKILEVSMDRIHVPSRLIRYGIVLTHTIRMALKDVEQRLEAYDEEPKPKKKRARAKAKAKA